MATTPVLARSMVTTADQHDPKGCRGPNGEQEEEVVVTNLPKAPSKWGPDDLYQYQGFWFILDGIKSVKEFQQNFQAMDTDLIIATLPRSGTLWLKSMAFAIIHRTRYAGSSKQHHPLLTASPHDLVPYLDFKHLYPANCFPDFTKFQSPRLLAVHVPYPSLAESIKKANCKIVYLGRNPKDNFISMWQFLNKLGASRNIIGDPFPIEEALDLFCAGISPFGPYWDHVLGYWKASIENTQKVLFLKYEDFKKDPKPHLKKLAEFLGYPFSLEEESEGVIEEILSLCSFEHLKNLDVNQYGTAVNVGTKILFRKGEVGDWKNYLTPTMVERFDRLIEEKMHGSGLVFQDCLD